MNKKAEVKQFEVWTHLGTRMAIDASNLFHEVVRVRKAVREENDERMRERLKSLTRELDETERILKGLRLGCAREDMVRLLNDWELAGERRLVLGAEALEAYGALAGCRIKPISSTKFNWREQRELEGWLQKATDSGVFQPTVTDPVVFSRAGRLGIMHVLGPLSFLKFKKWLASQPERSTHQVRQDNLQIDVVERLIAADLLSGTYDLY